MYRAVVSLLLACAPLVAQRGENPPFELPTGVAVESDIVYGRYGDREMKLDLYRPASGAGPFPGVVYIHGGGWSAGNRNQFRRQAAYLATKGFVGVCIEYRLSGEATYPAAVEDSKAAVRWLRTNAAKYRVDAGKIGAAGGSAGGHLVAMLGTTAKLKNLEGNGGNAGVSSAVQAVAALNGVFELAGAARESAAAQNPIQMFLGGPYEKIPSVWMEASPIRHAGGDSAPFLLLHGTADTTVPYRQSVDMQKALRDAGVRAEIYSAEGAKHGFFNSPPHYQPTLERMEQFFRSVLLGSGSATQ